MFSIWQEWQELKNIQASDLKIAQLLSHWAPLTNTDSDHERTETDNDDPEFTSNELVRCQPRIRVYPRHSWRSQATQSRSLTASGTAYVFSWLSFGNIIPAFSTYRTVLMNTNLGDRHVWLFTYTDRITYMQPEQHFVNKNPVWFYSRAITPSWLEMAKTQHPMCNGSAQILASLVFPSSCLEGACQSVQHLTDLWHLDIGSCWSGNIPGSR